jgi:hypothetical protein
MKLPIDHRERMERARLSLVGLAIGDALGEMLSEKHAGVSRLGGDGCPQLSNHDWMPIGFEERQATRTHQFEEPGKRRTFLHIHPILVGQLRTAVPTQAAHTGLNYCDPISRILVASIRPVLL